MSDRQFWRLTRPRFNALRRQWHRAQKTSLSLLAALRADLHNTSAKSYEHFFTIEDFLPGERERKERDLQNRVQHLIDTYHYTPSEAAAIAVSKQRSAKVIEFERLKKTG